VPTVRRWEHPARGPGAVEVGGHVAGSSAADHVGVLARSRSMRARRPALSRRPVTESSRTGINRPIVTDRDTRIAARLRAIEHEYAVRGTLAVRCRPLCVRGHGLGPRHDCSGATT
jgi:hypothetical protein